MVESFAGGCACGWFSTATLW